MFYKKDIKTPKTNKLEIEITDFSKGLDFNKEENVLKTNYSVNNYNFAYKKGVLTESFGLKTITCPNYMNDNETELTFNPNMEPIDLQSFWFFKDYNENNMGYIDKFLYYADNTGLYYNQIITIAPWIFRAYNISLTENPTFTYNIKINGEDVNLFGSENMGIYKFKGTFGAILMNDMPNISSMCEDKNKLFGTGYGEKNMIYFHMNNDVSSWTTEINAYNGIIYMNDTRGKINKVVPFLNYVFAIRDYGISKISHQEGKSKMDITHLSLSGNKIYENTVCICGDKMLMLTKEGICSFNGITTTILNLGINEFLQNVHNDSARAVFHSGKYYLACRVNFNDDKKILCEQLENYKNNAIIVLDVESLKYDIIRGVDVKSMESIKLNKMDKVAILLNNIDRQHVMQLTDGGCYYNNPLQKEWLSPLTDLGYSDKIKFVRTLSVLSLYDATITIFSEKESKTFNVLGKDTLTKIKVNLKGKQIGIKIESEAQKAYISNVKLSIDLLDYGFTK